MQALLLSPGEASRRVKAAEHLGDRQSMTGEPLGPWRPLLAEAQRRGEVTTEQVAVIDTALRRVDGPGVDPAEVEAGEQILVESRDERGSARAAPAGRAGGGGDRPGRHGAR